MLRLLTGMLICLALLSSFAATTTQAPPKQMTWWVALPEHNVELGLKPDGTVIWKQSLTNDGNVPYRTGP
jgi:hypothetical protein